MIGFFVMTYGYSQTTELLNEAFNTALPTELRNNTDPTFISETSLSWSGTSGNPSGSMSASGVVDEANGTAVGRAFQFLYEDNSFDFGNSSSLSISFDIKIDAALVNTNLQFQTQVSKTAASGGGVVVVNNENIQNSVTVGGGWTNLTFDMTAPGDFDTNGSLLIFFWNMAAAPIGGSGGSFEIDNIVVTGTDAAAPTCNDGIQNGNETGVDCGGPDCPPCATDPTDGPGHNGSTGTDFYIYSELSGNPNTSDFTGFNLVDFAGSVTLSQPDLNGDTVLKAENLDFFGSGFGLSAPFFNATGPYTYVHINYYATTSTAFNFSLVDDSLSATVCCGNPEEPFYRFGAGGDAALVTGSWQSVYIPLSHFATYPPLVSGTWDGTDLKQTLITGNGTVYIDNIYFSTSNMTLDTNDFTLDKYNVSPNPTNNVWNINAQQIIESVQLFDVLGKQVMSIAPKTSDVSIDASNLVKGLYFAKVNTEFGSNTIKLIKN